jgi:hypothetical protein
MLCLSEYELNKDKENLIRKEINFLINEVRVMLTSEDIMAKCKCRHARKLHT